MLTKKKPPLLARQSLGDTVDRLSILIRKIFFGEEDAYKEQQYIEDCLNKAGFDGAFLVNCLRLAMMNWEIWNLENDIRKASDPVSKLGFEEIGKRALEIRDFNKKRIKYKNNLNKLTNGFTEFKIKHRSQ